MSRELQPAALIAALLAVAAGGWLLDGGAEVVPDQLVLSADVVELGHGAPGETVRGTFWIRNAGPRSMQFTITRNCTCTELSPDAGSLRPGERRDIRVGITLPSHANAEKSATVTIKSPNDPRITQVCTVRAGCPAPFSANPAFADLGEVLLGTDGERRVLIQCAEGEDVHDLTVGVPPPFDAALEAAEPMVPRAVGLRIRIPAGAARGEHVQSIELRGSDPRFVVKLPVRARIVGELEVVPGPARTLRSLGNLG